ncbi:MAG TPA: TlpA disulfide reductase family protein [Polyangia bacterium]|nr:TlpA disulfide reductase family protein [Polyangia bacterium]
MKFVAIGVAASIGLLLVVLFALALPEAAQRARAGERRSGEAACEVLQAAPSNPAFASFPAPAPDFTLKDYAGRDVRLSALRGNVVLVNFWATWCGTCVVEMPSMEKLVASMKGKPFRLLAVSVDDDWPVVRKFFAKGTVLDIVLDKERETPKRWGTEKFPETFIVDKDGNIRYYVISDRDWSQPAVAACLESLMDG